MPHADTSSIPQDVTTKQEFYRHIHEQLEALLDGSTYWVSNLAQASSLLYHAYISSPLYGIHSELAHAPVVNWVGFYILHGEQLVLGPYQGRPACVTINPAGAGVCATAFRKASGVVVPDVDAFPGHIACDGETKSEIVLPLTVPSPSTAQTIGVLDLDSTVLATFDEDDRAGLQGVVDILAKLSEWISFS